MGQQMGTAHQPVQGIYFCPHNEKYICHLELSWQLRETKILVEIENDPKGWRTRALVFAAHTVIISDGWKQEGLELMSQSETFPAKQGSSHHVRERIHHLLTENGFSFTESQTSSFITSGSFGSSWCKPEAALLWGWCVSSHIPRCRTLSFPHSCGNTTRISPWLRDTNPGCHRRAWEWPPHTAKDPREGGIFVVTTSGGTGRAPTEERKPSGSRGVFGEENNS